MIARYFIARPVFAIVCAAFVIIAGLVALRQLPRAQWPNIQPRTISVAAYYPGANAETLAATVAAPLENAVGSVPGVLYTQSTSANDGQLWITVTFDLDANLDTALLDVNSRVQTALPQLPDEVRRQGVSVSKSSANNLLIATLWSPDQRFDLEALNNYAKLNVLDEIQRLPGVAGAYGSGPMRYYSMRIWLQPDKLARLGLSPLDVLNAVREQNSQYTAGRIGDAPLDKPVDFTFTVNLPGRLSTPEEFKQIVIKTTPTGGFVRLQDVARVELGSNRYDASAKVNGQWAYPISVTVQPDANAIETGKLVRARLQELSKSFPPGLAYDISYDSTIHVRNAIHEVTVTLFEALLLVFAVVFVFMGSWRATLIPMLAVPVSIVGAFVVMYEMQFTINTITLFGMVFAIGIVVDDAIVVIENVQRIMLAQGSDARTATEQAMREVTRPVIGIAFVLVAVFMPVAFMGGLTGTIYRQFAVTIAGAVLISGLVALTLTPALCANLLRASDIKHEGFSARLNTAFDKFTQLYMRGVEYLQSRRIWTLGLWLVAGASIAVMALRIPTSLVPKEDRSIIYAGPILPDAASMSRSQAAVDALTQVARNNPAVENVIAFAGRDLFTGANQPGSGMLWITLKPWNQRRSEAMSPASVVDYMEREGAKAVSDAKVVAFEPAPITGGSSTGGFEGYIQSRVSNDPQALARATQAFLDAVAKRPEVTGVDTSYRANVPQVRIDVDRDKAKALGVDLDELFTTLHTSFAPYYVNDFNYAGRVWEVQMQADAPFRARVDDLRNVSVRAKSGAMVPLMSLVRVEQVTGPEIVERYNGFPAARIYGHIAKGYSSGTGHQTMEDVARASLPPGYVLSWSGTSYQQRVIGKSTNGAFVLSVLMVFLILAALYENWSLPLAVILALPFAVLGAFVAIWLRGLNNDIFFQIGLVTLVGLGAKNGVLMVEYAEQLRAKGMSVAAAALQAARMRFRPIVMTSLAFVFGVSPLMFASGAGANGRHSIGTGVVGGMLTATFIATLFVPLFYIWIMGMRRRPARVPVHREK